jgi:Domain of unknown function (DUF4129)
MRLDQMTVALRVRSPWQAMDLGLRMVRANARSIWLPYFLFAGIVFLVCNVLAYAVDQVWLGWFLIWWLKPVFDRIPLHVLSHATFGSVPSFRDTLRAPFQWRLGLLFSWLTYRRFSFWRSMSLPIDILEGLGDERLSLRRSVLIGAVSSQMIGLGFVCLLFENVLMISAVVLFYMFIPVDYLTYSFQNFFTSYLDQAPVWLELAFNGLYFLSVAIISPFYVGAGFATYLNRRTQLEAWDIEIAFKRIASRLKQSSTMVLLLAVMLGGAGFSGSSQADDAVEAKPKNLQQLMHDDYRTEPGNVSEAIKKAYKDKNLSPKEKYKVWEEINKKKKKDEPEKNRAIPGLEAFFKGISGTIAFIAEYGLWLLLAILLSLLIWKAADWMPWLKDKMPAKRELDELSEKDIINLETLPSNLSSAVRKLWELQPRAALALLYRGSVEKLADRLGTPFPPGATEAECVRRSRRLAQPESEAIFQKVVRTWQAAAYAHRVPDSDEFESLLKEWSLRWERSA